MALKFRDPKNAKNRNCRNRKLIENNVGDPSRIGGVVAKYVKAKIF